MRKMQEELGMPQSAPNAEEASMDEEEYTDQSPDDGALTAGENVGNVPSVGGLGAPAYYQAAQKGVDDQIAANIALLTDAQKRLRERRAGPSDSEKWFAIAAALGKPTRTGSFGESLGNLNEALLEQKSARRKEREAQEALLVEDAQVADADGVAQSRRRVPLKCVPRKEIRARHKNPPGLPRRA